MSVKHVIFFIFCVSFQLSWSQNDTLVLKNKDIIVGEIKAMDKGVITIETDYSDSDFKITWLNIISVRSKQIYLLTMSNGRRINSSLITQKGDSAKATLNLSPPITVDLKDIVYIKPVEDHFLSRLKASVSLGYNVTKSNNLQQFSVTSTLSYTAYKWLFSGSYNAVRSDQDSVPTTQRTDANLSIRYFMKKDWFYSTSADFLSNNEQKLKLRSTIKGGLGKYFKHTNRLYFGSGFGLAFNNESFTDEMATSRNSLELYGSVMLNIFDAGDLDLNTDITGYPSLTEKGRFRIDYNINLKYDLPLDFFIKLGLTYNFDNKPVAGASESDYVIQTSFGWEFN